MAKENIKFFLAINRQCDCEQQECNHALGRPHNYYEAERHRDPELSGYTMIYAGSSSNR